jgi:hypothetical protein
VNWLLGLLFCLAFLPMLYLVYLFVSVVYLGESSACPQNLC